MFHVNAPFFSFLSTSKFYNILYIVVGLSGLLDSINLCLSHVWDQDLPKLLLWYIVHHANYDFILSKVLDVNITMFVNKIGCMDSTKSSY